MNKKENKTELIHIRIEPEVKEKSEVIFKKLGVNTSYAISMFLNQVILKGGFPFDIQLPKKKDDEYQELALMIESTAGNGSVSEKNKNILNLFATNQIDYDTAVFAIKRSFMQS
ncbi:MAG: type II toxin-antitoxin system RelB/DinJ family antitoxin [Acholeplasmatales bacterium]|nr:type II toxin-antitoxin system RelB/DinJ family antitoxin [Acholeplasmatales bacterium]